ncbi:MAG TPA: choice-of-anchor D domain-containing protein [Archangium sp.]|uniref:choice-of-anchor D domain-containing protein n=1 Tax=Archangium sp. TaxID=1872627 RepID=UPI002ED9462C
MAAVAPDHVITWSGGTSGCLTCNPNSTPAHSYACLPKTSGDWTKSFTDKVPAGYQVVGVEAKIYGASVKASPSDVSVKTTVGVSLNSLVLGSLSSDSRNCSIKSCDLAPLSTSVPSFSKTDSNGISGYQYNGGTNTITLSPTTDLYCVSHVEIYLTLAERRIRVAPGTWNFGKQKVGLQSAPAKTITVWNDGDAPLTVSAISPDPGSRFTVVEPANPSMGFATPIPKGGSRDIKVTFTPDALGSAQTGTLTITSNSSNTTNTTNGSTTVALSGTGVQFAHDVTTTEAQPFDFGEQRVGTVSSTPKSVWVQNAGSTILKILSLPIDGPFELVGPQATAFDLAPGAKEELLVAFRPSSGDGVQVPGSLTINTNAPSTDKPMVKIDLLGTGVDPRVSWSKPSLTFGKKIVGNTPATDTVVLRNDGTGEITVNVPGTISGTHFTIAPNGNFTLGKDESQPFTVTFAPNSTAPEAGDLTFTGGGQSGTVSLSGQGVSAFVFVLDPVTATTVDFGVVETGKTSTKPVKIKNISSLPITLSAAPTTSGSPFAAAAPSSMTIGAKGSTSPSDTVTVNVSFNPQSTGSFPDGVFTVSSNADTQVSPNTLTLSGSSAVATGEFRKADNTVRTELDFGEVRVNTTGQLMVRITNKGDFPLTFSAAPKASEIPTTTSSAFTYLGLANKTLNKDEVYEFPVSFSPTERDKTYNGVLTITSNASNSPMSLPLRGLGAYSKLEVSPTGIDFKDTPVSTSTKKSITISNLGNAAIVLQQPSVQGSFSISHLDGGTPVEGVAINRGTPFTFNVSFNPSKEGPADGGIQITDPGGDIPEVVIPLAGNGTVAKLQVSTPGNFTFGNQRVGQTSGVQALTIKNTGQAPLVVRELFSNNAAFQIQTPIVTPTSHLVIEPSGVEVLKVTFTPKELGSTTGTLTLLSNSAVDYLNPNMTGVGVAGQIRVDPDIVDLGQVEVTGTGTAQRSATITNIGQAALTISNVIPPDNAAFTVSGLPTGDAGLTLSPDAGWPFTVSFKPGARGPALATTVIQSDSFTLPNFPLALSGRGVAAAVQLVPEDVLFDKSNVGTATVKNLGIMNVGERILSVSGIVFTDVEGSDAGVGLDYSTVMGFPKDIDAGSTLTVPVQFLPRRVGARQAQAVIYSGVRTADGGYPVAHLLGVGTSPVLDVAPPLVDFGPVRVGSPSTSKSLKITNKGTGKLKLSKLEMGGPDHAAFSMSAISLPELPPPAYEGDPASSVEVLLTFTPSAERSFSGLLLIESSDFGVSSASIPLVGSGVRQEIAHSPAALDFGRQLINTEQTLQVKIVNKSDKPVTLASLSGLPAAGFSLKDPPGTQTILPADDELLLNVRFNPQSTDLVNGSLKIAFSEMPQVFETTLSGRGIASVLSTTAVASAMDFGTVRVGASGSTKSLFIKNESGQTITLGKPSLLPTGESFTVDIFNTLEGRSLDAGASLSMNVSYKPQEETLSKATLSFSTTLPDQANAASVELQGRGTTLLLRVEPDSLDFGRPPVNKPAEPKVVTVTNKSAEAKLVVVKLKSTGSPFTVDAKPLVDPLPPGASATFSVGFNPDTATLVEDEVQVLVRGGNNTQDLEAQLPVKGHGRSLSVDGGGCSTGSTNAGGVGILALLTLVGLRSRRRRE